MSKANESPGDSGASVTKTYDIGCGWIIVVLIVLGFLGKGLDIVGDVMVAQASCQVEGR